MVQGPMGGRLNRSSTVSVRPSGDSVTLLTSCHCDVLHPAKASVTHATASALPTMLVLHMAMGRSASLAFHDVATVRRSHGGGFSRERRTHFRVDPGPIR